MKTMTERIEEFWKVLEEIGQFESFWYSPKDEQATEKNKQIDNVLTRLVAHIQEDVILTEFLCSHCPTIGFDSVVKDQRFFLHLQDGGQYTMELFTLFKTMLDRKALKENLLIIAKQEYKSVQNKVFTASVESIEKSRNPQEISKMKNMRDRVEKFWAIIIEVNSYIKENKEWWEIACDLDQIVNYLNSDQKLKRFLEENYPPFLKLRLDEEFSESELEEQRNYNLPIIMNAMNSWNLRENILEEADNADRGDNKEKPESNILPDIQNIDMKGKILKIPPRKEADTEKSKSQKNITQEDFIVFDPENEVHRLVLKNAQDNPLLVEPDQTALRDCIMPKEYPIYLPIIFPSGNYNFYNFEFAYIEQQCEAQIKTAREQVKYLEECKAKVSFLTHGAPDNFTGWISNHFDGRKSKDALESFLKGLEIYSKHKKELLAIEEKYHGSAENKAESNIDNKIDENQPIVHAASKKIRWSADGFSKTVIGKIASGVNYDDDKSYRDFMDKKIKEKGNTVIKQTKASKKWLINMDWIREERKDLNEAEILQRLKAG
jgi:hypothetical protein